MGNSFKMAGKKHICFYLPSLGGGGAERVFMHLAHGFDAAGWRVDFLLGSDTGVFIDHLPASVRIFSLNVPRMRWGLPGVARYLNQQKPAVLISGLEVQNYFAALLKPLYSKKSQKVILTVHSVTSTKRARDTFKPIERLLLRCIYPLADEIVCVSHAVAQDLSAYAGIPPERVRVIYNPIILPELQDLAKAPLQHPFYTKDSRPVILAVGRLMREKGFLDLLEAFRRVRQERDALLVILGTGEQEAELRSEIGRLSLQEYVDLPGFAINPYSFMQKSALLVLPSYGEGLSTVLVEAMACGCPVVSTDCPGGSAEILNNGQYGHLVPVGDPERLAGAMLASLGGDTRRPTAEWLDQFTLKTVVQQYLELISG